MCQVSEAIFSGKRIKRSWRNSVPLVTTHIFSGINWSSERYVKPRLFLILVQLTPPTQIQAVLGGKIRLIASGSAPISRDVIDFLNIAFGCYVCEGLGFSFADCHRSHCFLLCRVGYLTPE